MTNKHPVLFFRLSYARFRSPAVLVHPVHAHHLHSTPSAATLLRLPPSLATTLYSRLLPPSSTEFLPRTSPPSSPTPSLSAPSLPSLLLSPLLPFPRSPTRRHRINHHHHYQRRGVGHHHHRHCADAPMSLEAQTTHHQLPPPPHHLLASSCPIHPDEHVTGFCTSCLCERLAGLDTFSTLARKSTSSAFKSFFFKAAAGGGGGGGGAAAAAGGGGGGAQPSSSNSTSSSFLRLELHRCKSFSCARGDGISRPRASAAFEPQRKSCDVRIYNTLWSLFHQDDNERDKHGVRDASLPSSSSAAVAAAAPAGEIESDCRNLGFPLTSSVAAPILESREEDEEEEERNNVEEIRVVNPVLVVGTSGEIEGGGREEEAAELKPMKEHPPEPEKKSGIKTQNT